MVAAAENNIIGKNNGLPWKLPNDFKYFKNKTWGLPVIMGRNTYESMKEELPGRRNIVVTRNKAWTAENVVVCHSLDEAIAEGVKTDAKEIFIVGGGEIFKESMSLITRIYLTRVHADVEGDATYPEIDEANWTLKSAQSFPADEKHEYGYTFEVWERN